MNSHRAGRAVRPALACALVAALALAGRPTGAVAGEAALTPAAVRALIRGGTGAALPHETRVVERVQRDRAGTSTLYRDGADERSVDDFGPLHAERGRRGGTAWHLNTNGELVLEGPDLEPAPGDRTPERVEPDASTPADVDLVETRPGGIELRTIVEPDSGRIVRVERIAPAGTTTTTYDDFRTTGTSTIAWHWRVSDGDPASDTDYEIALRDDGAVAEADLEIPPGRPFVVFPRGVSSVTLPATLRDGRFVVRVSIGGRGLDFLLDSGASAIYLDDAVARELELPTLGRSVNAANAGRYVSVTTIAPDLQVGTLAMRDVAMQTIPNLGTDEGGDVKIVGLLGFDFFADARLTLDYERGTVTSSPRSAAPPLANAGDRIVPVRLRDQLPRAEIAIDGVPGARFLIDTGAAASLLVFDAYARHHPEALAGDGPAPAETRRFSGIGGEFAGRPYRLHSVAFGAVAFADVTAYLVLSRTAYAGDDDGLVGCEVLRFFTVSFDYPDGVIRLELNAAGRAGMTETHQRSAPG